MGSPTASSSTPEGSTSRRARIVATYCAMMSDVAAPARMRDLRHVLHNKLPLMLMWLLKTLVHWATSSSAPLQQVRGLSTLASRARHAG